MTDWHDKPTIIINCELAKNVVLHILSNKAKAYRYCNRIGDLESAGKVYEHWIAITQVCEALGLQYPSINELTAEEYEIDDKKIKREGTGK